MAVDEEDAEIAAHAHSVFLRLVLPPYTIHFKAPSYMKESTLELLDTRVCKEVLKTSATNSSVRQSIGLDALFWSELVILLKAATTSLERRSFSIWDPTSVDYESTSGALIASHYPGLWKDLERLNNLVSIGRNVLTAGAEAQDLAAIHEVEHEIFKLINCAVRVTARGYDGEAGTGEEEKWQYIVNNYKKLLITSLQFLNNFVAQNERRKLMLWVNLFETSTDCLVYGDGDVPIRNVEPSTLPLDIIEEEDVLVAYGSNDTEHLSYEGAQLMYPDQPKHEMPAFAAKAAGYGGHNAYVWFGRMTSEAAQEECMALHGRRMTLAELSLDLPRRWAALGEAAQEEWIQRYEEAVDKHMQARMKDHARRREEAAQRTCDLVRNDDTAYKVSQLEQHLSMRYRNELSQSTQSELPLYRASPLRWKEKGTAGDALMAEDMKMLFTADAGTKILESGKAELMKRLEGYDQPLEEQDGDQYEQDESLQPADNEHVQGASSHQPPEAEAWSEQSEEDRLPEHDGSEEAEDDYPGSTEDGRGLLTDVPLILGPSEIEVLPMIVMSAIVPPAAQLAQCETQAEKNALINMHTVRCHLLFAQDNGRNLLRELLIFVAAWDLREEELYFKFMVKIMEAILQNGLMPYAYHAFRDRSRSKDIISPAQAVIMKLLTNIFRARSESNKTAVSDKSGQPKPTIDSKLNQPQRVDVHILNFIFTEFRQHIIPQTCALIFLQGQIHLGRASPEDFPLNLWDMERMYEGVYQYLEFFAVLTEEGFWKNVLAGWEISSELVTLLRELEGGIPKMQILIERVPRSSVITERRGNTPAPQDHRASSADARLASQTTSDANAMPPPLPPQAAQNNQQQQQIFEAETPLAYPEDAQDEPSDFEWRNLKKLTVLVLSSLIWKCRLVQDQVAQYGGLEALVACCKHDEHNPYIREHAIMCLRFAVEDHPRNAAVIRKMAAEGEKRRAQLQAQLGPDADLTEYDLAIEDVPREVLDANGYETFMDTKGQIGLRRKEPAMHSQLPSMSTGTNTTGTRTILPPMQAGMAKLTPEKAAELMQNALKELPLGMGASFAKGLEGLMKGEK